MHAKDRYPGTARFKRVAFDILYGFSAEGAVLLLAWGNAPGCRKPKTSSAESAIHFRHGKSFERLRRAFSAGLLWNATLGRCPRQSMNFAPLALNRNDILSNAPVSASLCLTRCQTLRAGNTRSQ
jgi:hypothetical protein